MLGQLLSKCGSQCLGLPLGEAGGGEVFDKPVGIECDGLEHEVIPIPPQRARNAPNHCELTTGAMNGSATPFSHGFPPVHALRARVLILGSLPGQQSLKAQQYYAQRQNAFWRIMGVLYGAGPELDYEARLAKLTENGVALWDVLASGCRPGSLDSAIDRTTEVVNDFASFFEMSPLIESIFFNGKKAENTYRRKVLPTLALHFTDIPRRTLPSTSSAYARMTFNEKLASWSAALTGARGSNLT